MEIPEILKEYIPYNEQEEKDKELITYCLKTLDNIYTRESKLAHFTASSWIVNKDRSKTLMIFHKQYNSWAWTGGHCDGETNFLKVALKEAKEETGLENISPISSNIFSIEILGVDGHIKKEEYVSSHQHINITYLLEANENETLRIKEDENTGVKWFPIEQAIEVSTETAMKDVYKKLNEKMKLNFPRT